MLYTRPHTQHSCGECVNEDGEKLRQAFLAVVETGNYAAAARALGRDASMLSRRVSALEDALGIRLLERSTRRVSTTEAGAQYHRKILHATQLIREAELEAQTRSSAPSGLLRLSLPTAFGRRWIASALPEFLKLYPAVSLETCYSDEFVDIIAEEFDLAVRIGVMRDSAIFSRKLANTRRVLCASPAYLQSVAPLQHPDDLRRVDCLMFTPMASHPVWHFQRQDVAAPVKVSGRLAANDIDALIDAALAGCGVLMAADWLVAQQFRAGGLVEVLPEWYASGEQGVYLLRPSRTNQTAKVRVFCDWLMARFASASWR